MKKIIILLLLICLNSLCAEDTYVFGISDTDTLNYIVFDYSFGISDTDNFQLTRNATFDFNTLRNITEIIQKIKDDFSVSGNTKHEIIKAMNIELTTNFSSWFSLLAYIKENY